MGRTKAIISFGNQQKEVLTLIGKRMTITEIKMVLPYPGEISRLRSELIEIGMIEKIERGKYKTTRFGRDILRWAKLREKNE